MGHGRHRCKDPTQAQQCGRRKASVHCGLTRFTSCPPSCPRSQEAECNRKRAEEAAKNGDSECPREPAHTLPAHSHGAAARVPGQRQLVALADALASSQRARWPRAWRAGGLTPTCARRGARCPFTAAPAARSAGSGARPAPSGERAPCLFAADIAAACAAVAARRWVHVRSATAGGTRGWTTCRGTRPPAATGCSPATRTTPRPTTSCWRCAAR